jgi:hypothetical protein
MPTLHTARNLALGLVGLFVLQGCYGTADSFIRRISKLSCVNLRECDGDAFEEAFDGEMDECRDESEDVLHEISDGCEYDADQGRECIHTAYKHRKDCDPEADQDISNDCAGVFDCVGVQVAPEDGGVLPEAIEGLIMSMPEDVEPAE